MAPRGIVHTCGDLFRLPTSPFHRAGTACQCVAWFHHQSYRLSHFPVVDTTLVDQLIVLQIVSQKVVL